MSWTRSWATSASPCCPGSSSAIRRKRRRSPSASKRSSTPARRGSRSSKPPPSPPEKEKGGRPSSRPRSCKPSVLEVDPARELQRARQCRDAVGDAERGRGGLRRSPGRVRHEPVRGIGAVEALDEHREAERSDQVGAEGTEGEGLRDAEVRLVAAGLPELV